MPKEKTPPPPPRKPYALLLAAFLAGAAAGWLLNGALRDRGEPDNGTELRLEGYQFINPLLECEQAEGRVNVLIRSFRAGLSGLADENLKSGAATDTAIYFRDLNNGPWYGINERVKFRPASLLKVPIAMAFYKAAEDDPGLLKRRYRFTAEVPLPDNRTPSVVPSRKIQPGREYSVEELIDAMIRYSDNQALYMLFGVIPERYLRDLYKALGVENDVLDKADGMLSMRSFGTFYRILFNASYLNRANSEKLLKLLCESEYKNALVAGVPPGTVVAHKFGEGGPKIGDRQLQDCGIVYYPGRPYLLCVMAKGPRLADLEAYIKNVSAFVYARVDEAARK